MTTSLLVFIVLSVSTLLYAAIRMLLHDGRGTTAPPASHEPDRQFRSPTALR